jgi:hypothetical protein
VLPHSPRNLQHPSGNRNYLPKVKGKGGLAFSAFIYVYEIVDNHQDHIMPQSELKRSTFWVECASIFLLMCDGVNGTKSRISEEVRLVFIG